MSAVRLPGGLRAAGLEWRARQIADPIERLGYLRRAARWHSRLAVLRMALVPVLIVLVVLTIPSKIASKGDPVRQRTVIQKPAIPAAMPDVWAVEQTAAFDLYSNGLRIENEFAVRNEPRERYPVYRNVAPPGASEEPLGWRTEPAGVVFHSSESDEAPFAPSEVRSLKRIGRELLWYVKIHRAYHFVIDKFGRVYRVVRESDKANHAGRSIWSDGDGVLLYLNASFLGVAFEARTEASNPLTPAQIQSARLLTEMLRSKYRLAPSSFVAHAQVSVNPSNMHIGYHTDWAAGLPFEQLGLPDNYARSVASVALFGFQYDDPMVAAMGGRPWAGLAAAEEALGQAAAAAHLPVPEYRKQLQQRYRRMIHAQSRTKKENQDEIQQE